MYIYIHISICELRGIEDSLPVQALLVFRQLAAYKMINEIKREEKENGKNKSKIMSAFKWNKSSSKNNGNSSPSKHHQVIRYFTCNCTYPIAIIAPVIILITITTHSCLLFIYFRSNCFY
jgi:hypothetical protein